jgi:hypothetical protein
MPPYAERIRALSGLPVYDLTTIVGWALHGYGKERAFLAETPSSSL